MLMGADMAVAGLPDMQQEMGAMFRAQVRPITPHFTPLRHPTIITNLRLMHACVVACGRSGSSRQTCS